MYYQLDYNFATGDAALATLQSPQTAHGIMFKVRS